MSEGKKLLIFAGTTEGRELAEDLDKAGVSCTVCTATEYGGALIGEHTTGHHILSRRMDALQIEQLIRDEGITHTVDATHPYAAVVTANIRQACEKTACKYLRLLRGASMSTDDAENWISVDSVPDAVTYLQNTDGIILAATGSKELKEYTALPDFKDRVVARILSTQESMDSAIKLGFAGKNLICMQGPFSQELNTAMLKAAGASWMVTKESGKTGGFPEKVAAAKAAGVRLIVVGRPSAEEGSSSEEIREILRKEGILPDSYASHISDTSYIEENTAQVSPQQRRISLIGIGMGTTRGMTREAWEECERADVLIGARRMLAEAAEQLDKPFYTAYMPGEIRTWVDAHPEYTRFAILLSGDVGFYSGAKKLEEAFGEEQLHIFCGISSMVYLCGQLHTAWEDVKPVSLHGRSQNLIAAVKANRKVFALVGKQESFHEMCRTLLRFGLDHVTVDAGCNLSYSDEKILHGTPEELKFAETGDLTAVLICNDRAEDRVTHGLSDEAFIRAKVPMTKEEVRSISLSKLGLRRDSVIYDVGAGTGSVSIEMALRATDGFVYAIEKKTEAAELIRENAEKLGASNLTVVEGLAPEALAQLPSPTHAFIGGSSGNLHQIMQVLLKKNPLCRIVINAIALETVSEALECCRSLPVQDTDMVCVTIGRSREVGRYHMMMGQNPVYVISCSGSGEVLPEISEEVIT